MRVMLLIFSGFVCCSNAAAQPRPLPSPEPLPILISNPVQAPYGRWWESFKYQEQCGTPVRESMMWSVVEGKVVGVPDGNTVVLKDKKRRRVRLIGIAAPQPAESFGEAARSLLAGLVLNQRVEVLINPSSYDDVELTGVVAIKGKAVNLALIESGMARYREPRPYSMSRYTACTYRLVEGEAREARRGLWQSVAP